jgi:hypothetical protein
MHSYAWHTGFNLDTELIEEVPVWIELPLQNQILEPNRRELISELGELRVSLQKTYNQSSPCSYADPEI